MDAPFWTGGLEMSPQACPVCGSIGSGYAMSDHIIAEHIGETEPPIFDMALVHQFIRQLVDQLTILHPDRALVAMKGAALNFMETSGIPGRLEVELQHGDTISFTYHPPLKLDNILITGEIR